MDSGERGMNLVSKNIIKDPGIEPAATSSQVLHANHWLMGFGKLVKKPENSITEKLQLLFTGRLMAGTAQ